MSEKMKGAITVGAILTATVAGVIAWSGFFITELRDTDAKIAIVQTAIAEKSERITVLETEIPNINERLNLMDKKLDELLRIVK